MDRLAKLKITCSNVRIHAKFDLLGENHGKGIADLQQKMSKEEELVVEKEKRVVTLAEMCSLPGHACGPRVSRILNRQRRMQNRLSWICKLDLPLHSTTLMAGVNAST